MSKQEKSIQSSIMLALSEAGSTVWRNETAGAWVGRPIHREGRTVTLAGARMLQAGLCVGSSDLICITPVTITPDMIGRKVGVFTAVEVKAAKGRVSAEQERFISAVKRAGGIAGVARSVDQAVQLLDKYRVSES